MTSITKMEDHGVILESPETLASMENPALSPSSEDRNSICSLPHDVYANSLEEIDNHLCEQQNSMSLSLNEKTWPNELLPENLSSNYEKIPLDSKKEAEKIQGHTEISSKNEEKCLNSEGKKMNITEVISHTESPEAVEEEELADDKDLIDPSFKEEPIFRKIFVTSTTNENSWKKINGTEDEPSIEDSCESRPVYRHEKIDNEKLSTSQNPKPRINFSEKSATLSDDSRLVKISLPTSSLNIMQTNAQFLNKSRNFLNFITEKSTNIMEKTLLPQNLAVRYNSILKMSDGASHAIDKKNFEEPSINRESSMMGLTSNLKSEIISKSHEIEDSPRKEIVLCNVENKNSPDLKSTEIFERQEVEGINGFFTNSDSKSVSISDFIAPEISPTLKNEIFHSSKNSLEICESETIDKNEVFDGNSIGKLRDDLNDRSDVSMDSSNSLLKNPVYLTLVRDYARARDEKIKLAERVNNLETRNRILEAQNSGELFNAQLETLEKTVERLTLELRGANANQEELGREYAAANKERESMVMKYAVSEKQLIDTQRARDYAEKRYKEIAKDHELLQNKLRQAQSERVRICNILDGKCRELTDSQKEVERLKEEVNIRDVKLKWTQTKLKTEMESLKETQAKLDKATARINDVKEECEQIRRESQEMIRKFHQSEENKAVTLDQQLKEQQARLILERHVTEDKEMLRLQLQKEVELLKNRQQGLIEENNTLSLKIQDLEKNRLTYESRMSDLKIVADQRQKEIVDLSAKVSHLETLKLQLIHKEQCLVSNEAEVERLRQVNQELQTDMDCCRQREAHMLDFTQKLTDKNVRLQSEFTAIEAKAAQLEGEQGPLREGIKELRGQVKSLEENLSHEKKKRIEECEILARHLAEQTQLAQNLTQKLEESQGEIAVLRRKQQISVKEMSRELQQCRKRLEAYETASPSNSLDPTSRTGSNSSLNAGETLNGASSDNSGNGETIRHSGELDRQSLIDRILKMQKINVRRAEKLDFLEEHTRTLVAELQKKTKIIQNYILHENFDAMGSNERDRHKAELARHGGIMASVYNHRVSDENMTLDLSLEINQKLQAVLEDALLKNITLKDNIDTLGEEIARLTIKNQKMLQQKGK